MKENTGACDESSELRRRAEETLGGLRPGVEDVSKLSVEEARDLLHELQVHWVELEMQNEELRRIQGELEAARDRYSDLYDFAPVGYFTVSDQGLIVEANLTGAGLLGVERGSLVGRPLSRFVSEESVRAHHLHLKNALQTEDRQTWELKMVKRDETEFWAAIETVGVRDGEGDISTCRMAMSDVTERKRAEERIVGYQEQLRALASELSVAEERERRRISVELHDGVAQALALSKMKLGALGQAPASSDIGAQVGDIRKTMDKAIQDVRSLVLDISPPLLFQTGLADALDQLCEGHGKKHGLACQFQGSMGTASVDDEISILLFRAVRELLTNVVKHARASRATVALRRQGDSIRVVVEDDGIGFEVSHMRPDADTTGGFGLFSLRERFSYIGGQFEVKSEPGRGTRVTLAAPFSPGPRPGTD